MHKTAIDITPFQTLASTRKRVAAYARVSSGKDNMLHSLAAQVDYYGKYIRQNLEWSFAGIYADEAVTGTKDNRAKFKCLLHDCRAGKIDMVITKSISRFARNTVTLLETVRELKSMGIDVYFEEQNIHSLSGDGELMLTIMASFAQGESLSCSENCKWRIRNDFKRGIPNTLRLYGFNYIDRELIINPDEARVVRMIYSDFLSGMGRNAITRKLIMMGVPTKNGGKWSDSVIDNILKNEKYTGCMLLQKTYSENHLTKARRINKGVLPMFFVKGTHEAIIEKHVFEDVQAEIKRRTEKVAQPESPAKESEFKGKIRCGQCGANFKRKVIANNAIWRCVTYDKKGKAQCGVKQIPEDVIQKLVTNLLGLDKYSASAFIDEIQEIRVPENGSMIFFSKHGEETVRTWANNSRRESWTADMRERARQRAIEGSGFTHAN